MEEVALDRFGSLDALEEAKEERRILDEREGRRADRGRDKGKGRDRDRDQDRDRDRDRGRGGGGGGERRMMFTDMSTPSGGTSRSSSFRRPDLDRSGPPTPGLGRPERSRLGQATGTPLAQAHTPVIPSAMTPALRGAGPAKRALSPSSLNKLQARVLRAKLVGAPNAEELEKDYERELRRAHGEGAEDGEGGGSGVRTRVEVMPTLDIHGRMYDVGQGRNDAPVNLPGNRRQKPKVSSLSVFASAGALRCTSARRAAGPQDGRDGPHRCGRRQCHARGDA